MSRTIDEDLVFRRVGEGFKVFRAYGGVETRVDVLKIGKTVTSSKLSKEALGHFVEEARRTAPDLSGIKKIWHVLPWLNTDVSFDRGWIVAGTVRLWQAAWYVALFGEEKLFSGNRASVTEEGIKPYVRMYWRREDLDRIIAAESDELMPLLGRTVKSWRELVDAINWSWVLERVKELVDELKPWIGRMKVDDAERKGLVRRMLGELALLAHFAEARRGMDDGKWREERAKKLAKVVEALSGGRIRGEYADELAQAIIRYAESRAETVKKRIENLAEEVGVSRKELWSVVDFILSDMYCLARDCARDEVVRKFVAPALELVMLDKALRSEFSREEARLLFGELYATAVAGDGSVWRRGVLLAVGGELGGGVALLRLATLHLLNQLLPDELKFGVRVYMGEGVYNIAAFGENAARFMRLLAVSAPSAGGGYLSDKFNEFVEEAKVEVQLDKNSIRRTEGGLVAADLTISEAGVAIKYNVYLSVNAIELKFYSTDRSRAELAAILLRLAGVTAEVKKVGDRGEWRIEVSTDKLAAGREELRKAIAEVVKKAVKERWVEAGRAERWLKKLEKGRVLKEGWPKYSIRLAKRALEVKYKTTNSGNIEQVAQRLEKMGLKRGVHFSVKMPEEGRYGYVSILKEGLAYAAWLSVHGKDEEQRRLATAFVEYILRRAEEAGEEVYEKVREIIEEGKARGSLTLKGFVKEVEVNGKTYVVKVIGGEAVEEDRGGKKLLRIRITAEVDGVRREYEMTYGRYGRNNAALGFATARADAPGGREADAERFSALIKALTGKEPRIRRRSDGSIELGCYEGHLEGFARYAELADDIERWLEETSRKHDTDGGLEEG